MFDGEARARSALTCLGFSDQVRNSGLVDPLAILRATRADFPTASAVRTEMSVSGISLGSSQAFARAGGD